MHDLRILLISSVLPRNTTGGELLLYRHFSNFPGLNLTIATDDCHGLQWEDTINIKTNRFLNRLKRTRLSKWIHDIYQCFHTFHDTKKIRQTIKQQKPDIILTVAHNELCWTAQQISQEFNIPLVTIFHDWWPDMAYVHTFVRNRLTQRFKHLYQQSQLVFCVDENIKQALGTHPNVKVLYPIPNASVKATYSTSLTPTDLFTVIYAGTLSGIYGPMMQDLCSLVQNYPKLQLKLFGPPLDWSDVLVQQVKAAQIYCGFMTSDLLAPVMKKASALLVVMSFNPQDQMRMQTSFPSKIPEYCQFGKPIIVWGPDYCSAVRWGRKHHSALVVTSPLAQDLVNAITQLTTQPQEQMRLGDKALEMAQGMFNPETIQQQFMNNLYKVATSKIY